LLLQAGEAPAPQGVFLDVVNAPLNLPLVARRVGTRWQEHRAVMFAETADLGVDLGIEPVGLLHGRLEVIQDQSPGHPAKATEGPLQAAEEVVGGLAVDRLAVRLAGVAEHDPQDMGLASLAVGFDDGGTGAEVDLGLVAGVALDASEGELARVLEPADEAADAVVGAGEAVVGDQVLVDPLRSEAEVALGPDQLPPRLTATGATTASGLRIGPRSGGRDSESWGVLVSLRAWGRLGWFWRVLVGFGAEGRLGWFWRCFSQPQVTCDGLAVDPQFVGDATLGPAPAMECTNGLADGHLEQIRHDEAPGAEDLLSSLTGASGSPQNGWFSSAPRWLVLSAR
jgi:hypothetical protein